MSYNTLPLLHESVSAVTATNSMEIGTRVWSGGREYVYVYNGGSDLYPGYCAICTGTTGYTVAVTFASLTTTALTPTVMGVCRNATVPNGSYGWIVTRGHTDLYNDGTASVTSGDMLVMSLNGKVRTASATSVLTALVYNQGGNYMKAMQSTDTAGTFGGYVRLG